MSALSRFFQSLFSRTLFVFSFSWFLFGGPSHEWYLVIPVSCLRYLWMDVGGTQCTPSSHYVITLGPKNTFLFSLTRSLLNQSPRNDTFPKVWPFSFILSFFLPGNWFPCLEAFSRPSFLPLHPNLFPNRLYFTKNQGMSYKKYLWKLCWNSILT